MLYNFLEDEGFFDFSSAAGVIRTFFEESPTILPIESSAVDAVADLMHLNAAEASLQEFRFSSTELPPRPLAVSERAAHFAIVTSDSGPFVGHDPREEPRLWDVTLYGSDASKLAWLADTDSVEAVAARFTEIIPRLAEYYRGVPIYDYQQSAEALQMRAILWRTKIAVLLQEHDFAGPVGDVANLHLSQVSLQQEQQREVHS
jgi:hypothetical protein